MNNFFTGTDTCFVDLTANGLNPSFFPIGSAKFLDLNYNILPFLCDLLKVATKNDVSPVFTQPPPEFDLTPFTDFSGLTAIGDSRVSLGETMTQTYIHFLPRVITQTEVRQAGGTQVIDNYICTADGTPIRQSQTAPVLLSLDLTGQKSYKYGAITVPPISSTYEELMKIIEPQEVTDFVFNYVKGSRVRHAESFADFIRIYFAGWEIKKMDVYKSTQYLIVSLEKNEKTVYLKYYADVANEVGCLLGLNQFNYYINYRAPSNMAEAMSTSSIIQNYEDLMKNPDKAREFYNIVVNNYSSTVNDNWSNLLTNTASARAIQYFNSFAARTSSIQVSSVQITQC